MSDSIDPNPLSEPSDSDVEVSQADERDAALAAVIREQAKKAEAEARARRTRIRCQGIGLRHFTLVLATAISVWIWVWPPGFLRIAPPGTPPMEEEEATLRLVMYFQDQKIEQYLLDTGGVPPGLRHQLPQGFSFDRERYQLDWENWILPEGMLSDSTVQGLIGISITTSDRSLSLALLDMIPMNAKFAFGETYTFIFATH
jgi:hypothetical protein